VRGIFQEVVAIEKENEQKGKNNLLFLEAKKSKK
jgi:hypothetical protein